MAGENSSEELARIRMNFFAAQGDLREIWRKGNTETRCLAVLMLGVIDKLERIENAIETLKESR